MTQGFITPFSLPYNPPIVPLKIIYQDADILVLDKPAGLLSVPGRRPEHKDCLAHRAKQIHPSALIVHRLDMDTSGVIIMALTPEAQKNLNLQFANRLTSKTYLANVWGVMKKDEGQIDLPLICDWPNRPKQMVDFKIGKPSRTDWKVIARKDNETHIELKPYTGRSHQLRVHMMSIGHPILGDRFYAHEAALTRSSRLCLHAHTLTISHPRHNTSLTFSAPCPF